MRRRILQMVTRSDWAGAQKVLYTIVRGLKNEFDIEVAYGQGDGKLIKRLDELGVKHHFIKHLKREISFFDDIKALREIYSIIKRRKYDVVHLHSSKAGFLGRIAAKLAGVNKVIYTIHGFWGIEQYTGLKKKMFIMAERFASKFTDKIILLCEKEREKARKYRIGKESQYVIIPNVVIPERPYPKGTLRKELGIPENVKIVGNVARLDRPKNPIRFLRIATEVLKKRDDVVFVWIGGSLVEDYYSSMVREYLRSHPEIKERVFFLGFREDAPKLMVDFDVFLLTSDYEGMPLVILEAISNRIPVVSTDVGCTSYLTSCSTNDTHLMTSYTLQALEGKKKCMRIKRISDVKNFVLKYLKLYTEE